MSKTLKIYQENDEYVMERINQFNHGFKESFDNNFRVEERLRDYAENGEDYIVKIHLDNSMEQRYLETYCNMTINLKATTWKNQKVNVKTNEVER